MKFGIIGFIGLGNMGLPMALNLAASGFQVRAFDISKQGRDNAHRKGLVVVDHVEDAVGDADAVITMLPAGGHVLDVWTNALPHIKRGALLIDCSTIDVDSTRKVHRLASQYGMQSLDAPVSGGVLGAQAGTLTFMVGGEANVQARAAPVLSAMGRRIVHCGAAGSGQAGKICNNMVLGITILGLSEAFVLGERLGLTIETVFDVISTSSGQSWALTNYCPAPGPVPKSPASNEYKPGFATSLMLKDMKLAEEAARQVGLNNAIATCAREIYGDFADAGNADRDFSAVFTYLRNQPSVS